MWSSRRCEPRGAGKQGAGAKRRYWMSPEKKRLKRKKGPGKGKERSKTMKKGAGRKSLYAAGVPLLNRPHRTVVREGLRYRGDASVPTPQEKTEREQRTDSNGTVTADALANVWAWGKGAIKKTVGAGRQ